MVDQDKIIFLHGSDSSSQTYKAVVLRRFFPEMVVPDFTGTLAERMEQLEKIVGNTPGWTMVGSSLGGLMAALFAARHPGQVRKLVLLAPALILPEFEEVKQSIEVPCTIVQGKLDEVLHPGEVRKLAEKTFTRLNYIQVEDDHRLHKTAEEMDWGKVLE